MGKKIALVVLVAAVVGGIYWRTPKEGLTVRTKNGFVKGIISLSRDGRKFFEWRGIPFGQAPVGPLRFQNPKSIGNWDGVRDGSRFGAKCAHVNPLHLKPGGDEDCLFLNVYRPKTGLDGLLSPLLPVMVYIHGGAFQDGFGGAHGGAYFMDEDVVLVTINYRLGPFGFLNTGDATIRGNMGLKDQVLALKWIQSNINAFGGDSDLVTIFGQSAGGASIDYLMLSPMTNGLFHKAIAQSGFSITPWAHDSTELAKKATTNFAAYLNCSGKGGSQALLDCLNPIDTSQILKTYSDAVMSKECYFRPHLTGHWFRPSVEAVQDEDTFLAQDTLQALRNGEGHRVPYIMGITNDEGVIASCTFYSSEEAMDKYEASWEIQDEQCFGIPRGNLSFQDWNKQIREFYFPETGRKSTEERAKVFTNFFTDVHFKVYFQEAASVRRQHMPTYLYLFTRTGGPSFGPIFRGFLKQEIYTTIFKALTGYLSGDFGVAHSDDLPLLFDLVLNMMYIPKGDTLDYRFSKDLVKLWTSFAADKSQTLSFRGVPWKPQEKTGPLKILELAETPKIIEEPFEKGVKFLRTLNVPQKTR